MSSMNIMSCKGYYWINTRNGQIMSSETSLVTKQ